MKRAYTIFLYISFVFLIIYLFKIDFISLSKVKFDFFKLGIAILFVFFGFIFNCLSWRKALKVYDLNISMKESVVSHGLPIFSKYIPGKIWTILGRAGLVSENFNVKIKTASYISLQEQLLSVFSALLIAAWLPSKVLDDIYIVVYLLGLLFLFFFLFNKKVNSSILSIAKWFRLNLDIPYIDFRKLVAVFFYCTFYWILWMLGFYFLISSIVPGQIDFKIAFVFPFSAIIGLLTIFVPGGLGVREGIMIITLVYLGFNEELAVSVSLISRVCFLVGEVFIFLSALFLKHSKSSKARAK